MGDQAGSVLSIHRYPVKSMRGERVEALEVTAHGAAGDRAWALRDLANGKVASCKRHPGLLGFRATQAGDDAPVVVEAPDGRVFRPDDPGASEIVSAALGHPMRFERDPGPAEVGLPICAQGQRVLLERWPVNQDFRGS